MRTLMVAPKTSQLSDEVPVNALEKSKGSHKKFAYHREIKEINQEDLSASLKIQANQDRISVLKKEIESAAYWSASRTAKIGLWLSVFTTAFMQKTPTLQTVPWGAFLLLCPKRHRIRDEKWKEVVDLIQDNAMLESRLNTNQRGKRRKDKDAYLWTAKQRIHHLMTQMLDKRKTMEEHQDGFNDSNVYWVFSKLGWMSSTLFVWSCNCIQLMMTLILLNKLQNLSRGC